MCTNGTRPAPGPAAFFVVDDDQVIVALLVDVVNAIGATLWGTAGSGEDALFALTVSSDRPAPDVVLVDVELPGIDGIETARRILATNPRAHVVLMSSHAQGDLPTDALDHGVAAFAPKAALSPALLAGLARPAPPVLADHPTSSTHSQRRLP